MRKLYVVCTTGIILIIMVHMFYMVAGLSDGVTINEDLAMNMGFMLMLLAILHGIYGLVKWIKVIINKKRLNKINNGRKSAIVVSSTVVTFVQRITGIMVVALIVPHSFIKIASAGSVLLILDIVFVLAIIVHLLIGIPKLLVSTGLLGKKFEEKCSFFFGGKRNA